MHFSDFHTHTCFSDGSDTPEQMVREAIARGMAQLGISDHSFTAFDTGYCLPPEKTQQYKASLQALKESYSGQIELFCGMEQDYYSAIPATGRTGRAHRGRNRPDSRRRQSRQSATRQRHRKRPSSWQRIC